MFSRSRRNRPPRRCSASAAPARASAAPAAPSTMNRSLQSRAIERATIAARRSATPAICAPRRLASSGRQPARDHLRDAVAAHRDAVQPVGGLHRALLVGDHDELRAVGVAAQQRQEAVDVEVVERGLDLVEDVERARPREEHGEQERQRGHRLLAARQQRQPLHRLARGRDLDLDAEQVLLARRGSPRLVRLGLRRRRPRRRRAACCAAEHPGGAVALGRRAAAGRCRPGTARRRAPRSCAPPPRRSPRRSRWIWRSVSRSASRARAARSPGRRAGARAPRRARRPRRTPAGPAG